MSQYVVTYFPEDTLVVAAVGPFRSLERAEAAKARLEEIEDGWDDAGLVASGRGVQVVELSSLTAALDDYE